MRDGSVNEDGILGQSTGVVVVSDVELAVKFCKDHGYDTVRVQRRRRQQCVTCAAGIRDYSEQIILHADLPGKGTFHVDYCISCHGFAREVLKVVHTI